MAEECERKNKHGVIITTYVESSTFFHGRIKDQIKRIKPIPFSKKPRTVRTHGYDRRAQLLAHAQQLRHPNSQQLDWPIKNLRPKTKKRRWSPSPARLRQFLCRLFARSKRRWRYERVVSDGKDGFYGHEGIKREKKELKTNGIKKSKFCGRLRKFLKDLPSAWKCKRGADDGEN